MCLDIGASTGGFTDVLLAHGAARVHAVDVGHGQLAWKLRTDPRVVVHERTNARYLTRDDDRRADRGAGLRCQLHRPRDPAAGAAGAVRAGRLGGGADQAAVRGRAGAVGSKGVVRDPAVHAAVCERGPRVVGRRCRAGACSASRTARSPARKATASS